MLLDRRIHEYLRCPILPGTFNTTPAEQPLPQTLTAGPACRQSVGWNSRITEYVNALHLFGPDGRKLSLDAQGNGSFKTHVTSYLAASAQKQLDAGKDLSDRGWLTLQDGKVKAVDFAAFARAAGR